MLSVIPVTTRRNRHKAQNWSISTSSAKRVSLPRKSLMPKNQRRHLSSLFFLHDQNILRKRKHYHYLQTTADGIKLNFQTHAVHIPTLKHQQTSSPLPQNVMLDQTISSAPQFINPSKPINPPNNRQISVEFRAKSTFPNDFQQNTCIYRKKVVILRTQKIIYYGIH